MSQPSMSVDVAELGAGSAGLSAWRAARKEGASVALIDPGPFGTTCARVGCMPSKLLIAAAHAAHRARSVTELGVRSEGVRIDGRRVMERVRSERDRFVGFVLDAAGQETNLDQLGLRNMGVEPNADGRYEIDPDTLQLGSAPVFVAGDVNQLHPVLHEAADDGRIAGKNAARYPEIQAAWRRTPLGIGSAPSFSAPRWSICRTCSRGPCNRS